MDADVAAGQQGTGGASQCEAPAEWDGAEEDGGVQGRKSKKRRVQRWREQRGAETPPRRACVAGVCRRQGGLAGAGCSVTRESYNEV